MMPDCLIKVLTPQGLSPVDYQAASLQEAERFEPDGIYTTTNTYHTFQALKLDAHLDRMEDSARRESIPLRLDRARLKSTLRQMIAEYQQGDVRFRVTVPHAQPDHFIITLEPFQPPAPALIESGVRCVTLAGLKRRNPDAKTTDWAQDRQSFQRPPGIYEVLLVSDSGEILEGFGSNFYAVLHDELRTAGQGVLAGIAQQIVFEVTPDILPLRKEGIQLTDLAGVQEAFLTSSSRGVIPIVEIDQITIGDGTPGKQTRAILAAYRQWVAAHLEDL